MSAPMAPGGAAAFDSEGRLLSVLAAGNQVLILDTQARVQVKAFTASVPDVCALALDGRAGRVAVGAPDGCIALHDVSTGVVVAKMTMTARSMTVLAFSPSGSLLASGDDDGHVVVYRAASGDVLRRIDTGEPISAIAVHDSGSPVLTGAPDGWVNV
jgi:WD40 repeat protein